LHAALSFGLAATVGDEDVRYNNAVLVLTVEHLHGFNSFWDWSTTTDKDTINI
jgi:hypothetical protein